MFTQGIVETADVKIGKFFLNILETFVSCGWNLFRLQCVFFFYMRDTDLITCNDWLKVKNLNIIFWNLSALPKMTESDDNST